MNTAIIEQLQFDERGLVPVVAQDCGTHEVLMLAYADKEALLQTMETGLAHYHSRSRGALWRKGETSGHVQQVKDVLFDCDRDAVLYLVYQTGPACHTGNRTCFYRNTEGEVNVLLDDPLTALQNIIIDRRENPREGSYTDYLFTKGLDKILKKVGEETAEVIIAAKNKNAAEVTYETADLLYHLSVLLTERGVRWADVFAELHGRQK